MAIACCRLLPHTSIACTHIASLPIAVAGTWWGEKGIWVAGLLAAFILSLRRRAPTAFTIRLPGVLADGREFSGGTPGTGEEVSDERQGEGAVGVRRCGPRRAAPLGPRPPRLRCPVACELRNLQQTRRTPILMATSVDRALRKLVIPREVFLVVDAFIEKPVEPGRLAA